MDWKLLFQKLDTLVDAANCMEKTAAIYENDRWCTTSKNAETAQYCAEVFRNAGLDQVELLPLAADSKTKYFDWSVAKAWDADYGILQYADGELISDYHKMPCSLVMYCPSTPTEGIEAEVIEITDADYTMDLEDESLGAEINAAAHRAGAGQIKPLSAVPSQEGMRSCSSHQQQGSCQLCPSGGCCHDKLPKGASAQFLCLFHSRWAGRKQISSFSGSLAVIRLR